jgi:resuscitation-promoting factor RpfB
MRPSRKLLYAFTLAAILVSQQIVSQTQPAQSQPSTNSAATSNTKPNTGHANCTNNGTYVNSNGQTVQRPENCSVPPKGASAQCRDGSSSFSTSRRGTCSHHGGVAKWF